MLVKSRPYNYSLCTKTLSDLSDGNFHQSIFFLYKNANIPLTSLLDKTLKKSNFNESMH